MKEQDVIKEGVSEWCFSLVIVRKKDNTWRLCIDFRALNAVTVKDFMRLPRINIILDSLGGSIYYTSFDLIAGYWQIALDPEKKTQGNSNLGLNGNGQGRRRDTIA